MMKKQKMGRRPIPRPVKAIFCTVCAAALALLCYIALGSPTLTFEQEFRRAEKANLIGPSRIVDTLEGEYGEFEKMIVGETEQGVCFFGGKIVTVYYDSDFKRDEVTFTFSYREKTGDITVLAAPNRGAAFWDEIGVSLPVYVFDDYPEAVRAELELTVTGTHTRSTNGYEVTTDFSEHFSAEAQRTEEGFFRFLLDSQSKKDAYALQLLSNLSGSNMFYTNKDVDSVVPGTLRLYDAKGNLILEREFEICSAIAAAHK